MRALLILSPLLLAACNGHGGGAQDPTGTQGTTATNYTGIGKDETLHFTGTEPFWGGTLTDGALTYTTPENPNGTVIPVRRFAGNNGLAFSGALGAHALDMAVTEAPCSDGMSDRTYPFTVSLQIGDEQRRGCAWTDKHGFAEKKKA